MAEQKQTLPNQDPLSALSKKYDAMIARMPAPAARKGMKAAFDASPKQFGKCALEFARRRG